MICEGTPSLLSSGVPRGTLLKRTKVSGAEILSGLGQGHTLDLACSICPMPPEETRAGGHTLAAQPQALRADTASVQRPKLAYFLATLIVFPGTGSKRTSDKVTGAARRRARAQRAPGSAEEAARWLSHRQAGNRAALLADVHRGVPI